MTKEQLKARTKAFAIEVVALVRDLPPEVANDVIGKQLLRSATSVAANYRAVCRAKSGADAISKFGTVEEEADESMFWLELLMDTGCDDPRVEGLWKEGNELISISVASIKTMKARSPGPSAIRNP